MTEEPGSERSKDEVQSMILLALFGWILAMPWWSTALGEVSLLTSRSLQAVSKIFAIAAMLFLAPRLLSRFDPLRLLRWPGRRAIVCGVLSYLALVPLLIWLTLSFDSPEGSQRVAGELRDTSSGWLRGVIFVYAVLVTPFFEEIIFRGLLQGAFRAVLPALGAVALASFLFALVHPLPLLIPIALLSILIGVAFERSRSLWLPILLHALHNGVAYFVTVYGAF